MEIQQQRRERMVTEQIESRGISDPLVLAAMRAIPRHLFVSSEFESEAYEDHPVPIGHGQTISQPYIVAYMTQVLGPDLEVDVLEIGTGCGYQTAVLAACFRRVYTVEIVPQLLETARNRLTALGTLNVEYRIGDGRLGWPGRRFERILAAAAPDAIPEGLLLTLTDGGRMVIPVGADVQDLLLVSKESGVVRQARLLGVRFVPMTG